MPTPEASAFQARTCHFTLARPGAPFHLQYGGRLENASLAYESYGSLDSRGENAVLICHGFTADAHAAGKLSSEDNRPGWWDTMIGPGKAFDTNRFFVVSSNSLGGCKGSEGPSSIDPLTNAPYGSSFPEISIGDMVRAQYELLLHLGVRRLVCVTGASMGGQQTLEWILTHPEFVASAIPVACTARLSALGLAMAQISRQAIFNDPYFNGGDYYGKPFPEKGLALARMAAHLTYVSSSYLNAHYGRKISDNGDFAVQKMLSDEGGRFIRRFDANSFLILSNAIEKFDIANPDGSLDGVFAKVLSKILLIAFSTDFLFPPGEMLEIYRAMKSENIDVSFETIETIDGHDAFLTDWRKLSEIVSEFLSGI